MDAAIKSLFEKDAKTLANKIADRGGWEKIQAEAWRDFLNQKELPDDLTKVIDRNFWSLL